MGTAVEIKNNSLLYCDSCKRIYEFYRENNQEKVDYDLKDFPVNSCEPMICPECKKNNAVVGIEQDKTLPEKYDKVKAENEVLKKSVSFYLEKEKKIWGKDFDSGIFIKIKTTANNLILISIPDELSQAEIDQLKIIIKGIETQVEAFKISPQEEIKKPDLIEEKI